MQDVKPLRDSDQILKDYFRDDTIVLVCGKHHYAGGQKQKPVEGCVDCAHVMWRQIISRMPGDKMEAVNRALELVHEIIRLQAAGKWDFVAQRPNLKIEKGN